MRLFQRTSKFWGALIVFSIVLFCASELLAQRGGRGGGGRGGGGARGGGGGRPSMGRVGGGGSRPSMSRPSSGSRPSMSRPSGGGSRPSFGNAGNRPSGARPSPGGQRPSMGGSRPSLGGVGGSSNMNRPSPGNRPGGNQGIGNRPNVNNSIRPRPSTRPDSGFERPSAGDRPSIGDNRPSLDGNRPGGNRPSFGNATRPEPRPSFPGGNNRPDGIRPDGIRPGGDNRPDGIRPGGDNRPGDRFPNRPDGIRPDGDRFPNRGDGLRPDRPTIGGDRPGFGDDTINIGNDINIGNQVGDNLVNRPNWDGDPGYSRPGWGIDGDWHNDWHNNWHDHCIHDHHHWYNGCWHGYWGSSWYAPVAWGAVGWGLGYGSSYYNPYYAEPLVAQAMPYDYSQPVVVNNYVPTEVQTGDVAAAAPQAAQPPPESEQSYSAFDTGLQKFKSGDYLNAVSDFNASLKQFPGDPVVHEVRALALFAVGKYSEAAASLNSLLSAAPGMDWTTMSGLYGNPDDYTSQLRKLEQHCASSPTDAAAYFVLAYHYLVTDAKDEAIEALKVVVKNQPKDVTAKKMLDSLAPPATSQAQAAAPTPTPAPAAGQAAPETDLVGTWKATAGQTAIELSITEDSQFTWTAKTSGKDDLKLTGTISAASDGIALKTADQGTMAGTVISKGKDAWQFAISGAPASDPGLSFTRIN